MKLPATTARAAARTAAAVVLAGSLWWPPAVPAHADSGRLKPGDRYDVLVKGRWTSCSIGPYLRSRDGQIFALTAGHCADDGDPVFLPGDHSTPIGTFADPRYVTETKYLIQPLYDMAKVIVDPSRVDTTIHGEQVAGIVPVDELWAAREQRTPLTVCALGALSGYQCGPFTDIARVGVITAKVDGLLGDSGGVVFISSPQGARVVGTIYGGTSDPNQPMILIISPVESAMRAYDAELATAP